jgi:hypothetical protein
VYHNSSTKAQHSLLYRRWLIKGLPNELSANGKPIAESVNASASIALIF